MGVSRRVWMSEKLVEIRSPLPLCGLRDRTEAVLSHLAFQKGPATECALRSALSEGRADIVAAATAPFEVLKDSKQPRCPTGWEGLINEIL